MNLRLPTAIAVTLALAVSNVAHATKPDGAPLHVSNWAYYGFGGEGLSTDASWMAQHATFVEAAPEFARRFKAAGGRYAVAYADPFRVIPERHESLSDLPERAWLHDAFGRRISYAMPGWGVQNQLNPSDPLTIAGYKQLTTTLRDAAPYDFIELDDASFDLDNVFWHFSARAAEVKDVAQYDGGVVSLINASALPSLVSGFSNEDGHLDGRSGNLAFLPYAAGAINNEGCLTSTLAKSERQWIFDENTLQAITAAHKEAVCWGQSAAAGDTRVPRLFFYASWLLTYDPQYSVVFEDFDSPKRLSVFPEEEIVPRDPVQTVRSTITELKSAQGYYLREFRRCYDGGKAFGPCAAVVNPTNDGVSIAGAAPNLKSQLVVDVRDSAAGGSATWTNGQRPLQLDPHTAVVLR